MLHIIGHDLNELFPSVAYSSSSTYKTTESGCSSWGTLSIQPDNDASDGFSINGYVKECFPCWFYVGAAGRGVGAFFLSLTCVIGVLCHVFFSLCLGQEGWEKQQRSAAANCKLSPAGGFAALFGDGRRSGSGCALKLWRRWWWSLVQQ